MGQLQKFNTENEVRNFQKNGTRFRVKKWGVWLLLEYYRQKE